MDDRRRNELMNQYDELTMQLLMDEAAEADGRLLWEDFTAHGAFMTEKLDDVCSKRIQAEFRKSRRKRNWTGFWKRTLRAAVVALCLFNVVTILVMKVDALRVPIMNYLIETYEEFSVIAFENSKHEPTPQTLYEVMENNVPEGYVFIQEDFPSPNFGIICFETGTGERLALSVYPSDMEASYDTEDAMVDEAIICGISTIVIEKITSTNHYTSIIWLDIEGNTAYNLSGSGLSMESMIYIAAPLIEFTAK